MLVVGWVTDEIWEVECEVASPVDRSEGEVGVDTCFFAASSLWRALFFFCSMRVSSACAFLLHS